MGIDSIVKGVYIVCRHTNDNPYGYMVAPYRTKEEAEDHIKYQKTVMHNTSGWSILHIKDMEWVTTD
jgi:hypothetical protein